MARLSKEEKKAKLLDKQAKNLVKLDKIDKKIKRMDMTPGERMQEKCRISTRRNLIAGTVAIQMIKEKCEFTPDVLVKKLLSAASDFEDKEYFKGLLFR